MTQVLMTQVLMTQVLMTQVLMTQVLMTSIDDTIFNKRNIPPRVRNGRYLR
jgi:hypothetical protein